MARPACAKEPEASFSIFTPFSLLSFPYFTFSCGGITGVAFFKVAI
jgi:hypothetical protein